MSRTFRCKSSAPTGMIVRDGCNNQCYNYLGAQYHAADRYENYVHLNGMQDVFGFTDISEWSHYNLSIVRAVPKWFSYNSWKRRRRLLGEFKSLDRKSARRTNREVVRSLFGSPSIEDTDYNFVKNPARKFKFNSY